MSVFVNKEAEIVVNLFVYKNEKGKIFAWTKNIQTNKPQDLDSKLEVSEYKIQFRLPTYKDTMLLLEKSISFDQNGILKIASTKMAYDRFLLLLKKWDFKDQNGELVPETKESVDSLETEVAQAITIDLESQLENS